jgi:hypothetical protein
MAETALVFGESDTYKTTNLGFAAKWIYEKTGKKVRMISYDGGKWRPLQPLVDVGVIEPIYVADKTPEGRTRKMLENLRKFSAGYWPKPGELKDGNWLGTELVPTKDYSQVGGYLFEGLTSSAEGLMRYIRDNHIKIGPTEDAAQYTDGSEKFWTNVRSHYNAVQGEILGRIRTFSALPVEWVIFSAHEAKGEDEETRMPIRGPGIVGKAATDRVAKEVGDCIHFEKYTKEEKITDPRTKEVIVVKRGMVRAFFTSHPDQIFPKISYKCKPRVPPEMVPELLKKWPGGYFTPTTENGLDVFLRFEDELIQRSVDPYRKWKATIDQKHRPKAA